MNLFLHPHKVKGIVNEQHKVIGKEEEDEETNLHLVVGKKQIDQHGGNACYHTQARCCKIERRQTG